MKIPGLKKKGKVELVLEVIDESQEILLLPPKLCQPPLPQGFGSKPLDWDFTGSEDPGGLFQLGWFCGWDTNLTPTNNPGGKQHHPVLPWIGTSATHTECLQLAQPDTEILSRFPSFGQGRE